MKISGCVAIAVVMMIAGCAGSKKDVRLDVHGDVKSLSIRGNEMYFEGRYEDAARYYDRAKVLAMSIDDRKGLAEALNNLGQLYMIAGEYPEAYAKFEEAYRINDGIGDASGMAANLVNVGSLLQKLGSPFLAGVAFDASLYYYSRAGDALGMATVLNNVGLMNVQQGDFESADRNLNGALKVALEKKRHRLAAACYQNLGTLAEAREQYEPALRFYKLALAVNIHLGFKKGIADDLKNLIVVASEMGDRAAVSSYQKQLKKVVRGK